MAPRIPAVDTSEQLHYVPGRGNVPVKAGLEHREKLTFDWVVAPVLLITPLVALWACFNVDIQTPTLVFCVVLWWLTGFGITAGYHRLFSHRAYDATAAVRLMLLLFAAATMQGSCRWWSKKHRAHHKFTDTSKDPYAVTRSFLWAHMGWMIWKSDKRTEADISDLDADPLVRFQHKFYAPLVILCGVVIPWCVCGFGWGDWRGGFYFAVIARLVWVHQSTFFVNSLAHYLGTQTYSEMHSAVDSIITAVLTLGEGYHNYHHEFAADYRNGIRWYHFDPTKWFIVSLYYLGLVSNLRYVEDSEITKAKLQVLKGRLAAEENALLYGKNLDGSNLPVLSRADVRSEAATGKLMLIVAEKVYDLTEFADQHPGGRATIVRETGRDVTSMFNGSTGLHVHSPFAVSLLRRYIVGRLPASEMESERDDE